jgi:hypothetical protein
MGVGGTASNYEGSASHPARNNNETLGNAVAE